MAHALDTVSRNVQQIVALINDILFLQELDLVLPKFQAVNMGEVASNVLEKCKRQATKRSVHLSVKEDRKLPPVSGDANSLERALMVLVENAKKFSPKRGDVEIHLKDSNGQVIGAVEDYRIGIPPEKRPHIFDRFYHLEK